MQRDAVYLADIMSAAADLREFARSVPDLSFPWSHVWGLWRPSPGPGCLQP